MHSWHLVDLCHILEALLSICSGIVDALVTVRVREEYQHHFNIVLLVMHWKFLRAMGIMSPWQLESVMNIAIISNNGW